MTCLPNRREANAAVVQLGPLQGDWASGGLDRRWPIAIARPRLRIRRGRGLVDLGANTISRRYSCGHGPPPAILLAKDLTNHLMHGALAMKVFSMLSKPVDLNVLLQTPARVVNRHYAGRFFWPVLPTPQQ